MCKDYITEKYWDHLGKVCVVLLCRGRVTVYLTIIARARMGSEPKDSEAMRARGIILLVKANYRIYSNERLTSN